MFLVPEGVDTDRFDPEAVAAERVEALRRSWGLTEGARVILLAARLTGWKGQGLAIDALARGVSDDAVMILAGADPASAYGRELAARARAAGLGERVRLVGPVADMPAAWLAADLVIAPSTEPESFGRSVAEACAMGRVVLASDLGATAEVIEDGRTGRLVTARDVAAWAEAITAALRLTPSERAAMGAAARERVRRLYSSEAMARATFAVYRRVIERAA